MKKIREIKIFLSKNITFFTKSNILVLKIFSTMDNEIESGHEKRYIKLYQIIRVKKKLFSSDQTWFCA